jgi:naphthoate synthase
MGSGNFRKVTNAIKMLKFAMNLTDDGMVGQQVLPVRRLDSAYMTAKEGRNAFLEKENQIEKKWLP